MEPNNTELLNKLLQNVIPEFDNTVANRNTYVADGNLMRWVDGESLYSMPERVVLRELTKKEIAVWEAYVNMVEVLSDLNKEEK